MAKKEKEVKKDSKNFSKGVKAELKKVTWLTPKQLVNNTVAVLAIVIIIALIVFVLDIAFQSMNIYGIDKIKAKVSNSAVDNTSSEDGKAESQEETEGVTLENEDSDEATEKSDETSEETENEENGDEAATEATTEEQESAEPETTESETENAQ